MAGSSAIQNDTGNDMANWSGRMRPFLSYRSRYSTLGAIKERCNSNSSLASFSGSTQNLLDPVKLMSMQDDARCRKISAEVMKRCLYKPDAPCRRRAYSRGYNSSRASTDGSTVPARMFQSLPVTPMQSLTVTPSQSPTNIGGYYYSFLSRGTTPRVMTPEPEEDTEEEIAEIDAGLASVFRPQPRYIRALPTKEEIAPNTSDEMTPNGTSATGFGAVPRSAYRFRSLNMTTSEHFL